MSKRRKITIPFLIPISHQEQITRYRNSSLSRFLEIRERRTNRKGETNAEQNKKVDKSKSVDTLTGIDTETELNDAKDKSV